MTGNIYFPGPVPSLDAAITALDEYAAALTASYQGDRLSIALKSQKKDILIDKLHILASYVLLTAKDDVAIAISSKFTVRKKAEPRPPIQKPASTKLENGINTGELIISVPRVADARMYIFQTTADPITSASEWINYPSTKRKKLLNGFTSRAMVWGRTLVLGVDGREVYSDPVCRVVQ